jgi:16S rRNA processing protein RimM
MGDSPRDTVVVGTVSGLFGVQGYVKLYSYTDPPEGIFAYRPWLIVRGARRQRVELEDGRRHGKGLIAKLEGCDDRDAAALLVGAQIEIDKSQLADLAPGEYYWADLIGLRVLGADGSELGVVERLLETGANDVLVVKGERERLIPFLPGRVVSAVDLERGELKVDWDPDF